MKTGRFALISVLVTFALTGCSAREVYFWFRLRGADLPVSQVVDIATKVNAQLAPGCDGNYSGTCVPNNVNYVECATDSPTPGIPQITGPVAITGWDSFGIDDDENGVACDETNPVLVLDDFYRDGGQVVAEGWAIDPDSSSSIQVHFYIDGTGYAFTANEERPDLAFLGNGTAHGFTATWPATVGDHEACVFAINVYSGSNTVGCLDYSIASGASAGAGALDVHRRTGFAVPALR